MEEDGLLVLVGSDVDVGGLCDAFDFFAILKADSLAMLSLTSALLSMK